MIEYNPITGEKTEVTFKLKDCPKKNKHMRRTDMYGDLVRCESCGAYGGHQVIAEQVVRKVS